MNYPESNLDAPAAPNRKLIWFGAVFALVFPTVITWVYFVYSQRFASSVQQAVYVTVKVLQFAFPVVWVWLVLREPLVSRRPTTRGMAAGAAFGAVVVGASWVVFEFFLRDTAVFLDASAKIRDRLAAIGIDATWKYVALGVVYALFHSLLEEYYWRWFAFGQLRRLVRLWPAIIVAALAFMGHHVVVLGEFFKDVPAVGWLLSTAVAVGGAFWAWLYDRTGSLLGPWISHLIIDAGIFWVGFQLVGDSLSAAMP